MERRYSISELNQFANNHRLRPTKHEALFIERLRQACITDYLFQVRIGFYIADFVFPSQMLIIELDGPLHDADHDERRDAFLARAGFSVRRIKNRNVEYWDLSKIQIYSTKKPSTFKEAIKWANKEMTGKNRRWGQKKKTRKCQHCGQLCGH